jgi:hypothetical protein
MHRVKEECCEEMNDMWKVSINIVQKLCSGVWSPEYLPGPTLSGPEAYESLGT